MNSGDILPIWITVVTVIFTVGITALVHVSGGPPYWPARYPYAEPRHKAPGPLRRACSALRARLGHGLVGDDEWDATCRRAGWEPSEDERTRT